jgi:hypothetical protein
MAGMCWSQLARVDHMRKSGGQEEKKFLKKGLAQHVQAWTCDRRATAGPRLDMLGWSHLFFYFLFILFYFLEVWEMGQGFWNNGCIAPHFLKLYLEV